MYTGQKPAEIDQGTIIEAVYFYAIDDTRPGVILTPTCDFEQNKAELAQVCALFDLAEVVRSLVSGDWAGKKLVDDKGQPIPGPLSGTKKSELGEGIRQIITQRIPRFHWFRPIAGTSLERPFVADFQVLASVPAVELGDHAIVAGVDSPYRQQIAARYAAYMGRVGTPDISKADMDAWIDGIAAELFPPPN